MLERHGSDLADSIRKQYGYEQGYKTVVNVLRLGEDLDMTARSPTLASCSPRLLNAGLASSKIVRDVRVFGLLIGIELDIERWPHRWLRKRLSSFYLLSMLRHRRLPRASGLLPV